MRQQGCVVGGAPCIHTCLASTLIEHQRHTHTHDAHANNSSYLGLLVRRLVELATNQLLLRAIDLIAGIYPTVVPAPAPAQAAPPLVTALGGAHVLNDALREVRPLERCLDVGRVRHGREVGRRRRGRRVGDLKGWGGVVRARSARKRATVCASLHGFCPTSLCGGGTRSLRNRIPDTPHRLPLPPTTPSYSEITPAAPRTPTAGARWRR